jgi:uncharacterized Zn finger protein (UPF0148 family)
MAAIEVSCSQCGAGEYQLVDARTGKVACLYCRNQWVVPELAQKSETEKFQEAQAKRPQVTVDNTTQTDRALMEMVTSVAQAATNPVGSAARGCFRTVGTVVKVTIAVVVVVIIAAIAFTVFNTINP